MTIDRYVVVHQERWIVKDRKTYSYASPPFLSDKTAWMECDKLNAQHERLTKEALQERKEE